MKRKLWQRRLLCCFLAVAVLLGGLLCCLPVRAGAIVPLGLVQSALASYVTSTGYKMYNDQGTGQDILSSLSDLYQTWLDSPAGAAASQWTLAHIAAIEAVYTDTSGQIVIKKAAADVFQQFADWIQTEYSVPVGSDEPTTVLSGDQVWSDGNGIVAVKLDLTQPCTLNGSTGWYYADFQLGVNEDDNLPTYLVAEASSYSVYATRFRRDGYDRDNLYLMRFSGNSGRSCVAKRNSDGTFRAVSGFGSPSTSFASFASINNFWYKDVPLSSVLPSGNPSLSGSAAIGLGVSLAQSVADVVGQAKEDDAVVIGVGAGVGATAQDIADMVAQGVKAQTLDPSVSITAEAVIDTPVQPYPDIDGLGLPTLGAALVSRFPFCVPWDFVDTLKILNADPIPPVFDVTLLPASVAARWGVSGNFTIHVDLTSPEYAKLFVALRWGTLVGFCLGLALLTKRLIWTA